MTHDDESNAEGQPHTEEEATFEQEDVVAAIDALADLVDSKFAHRALSMIGRHIKNQQDLLQASHLQHEKLTNARTEISKRAQDRVVICLVLCLTFLFGVIWLLQDDPDTLLPVITALIGLIAGAGGGWVFGNGNNKIQS